MLSDLKSRFSGFTRLIALLSLVVPAIGAADFNVRVQTDLGALDIVMLEFDAPLTVANFMNYVNRGDYAGGMFFHRSIPGFILQSGGYVFDGVPGTFLSGGTTQIPADPPVVNEFNLSNLRGTLAMAKVDAEFDMSGNLVPGTGPDSATSQFFFNLADNSASLDTQNGGFTVFARVLGNGMDVVDALASVPICPQVAPFFVCGFPYTSDAPLVNGSGDFVNTIIDISIGLDGDGDGAIDNQEDLAPNGDGNNDLTADSLQQHVASYQTTAGDTVVVEAPQANPLQAFNALDTTFGLVNLPAQTEFSGILLAGGAFDNGFVGYDLTNVMPPSGTVDVSITLPAGVQPNAFYNYGPEPGNPVPHWYEFSFNGTTGAIFNNNQITLRFVDGLRGDSDLDSANGVIAAAPGGAVNSQLDLDGVSAAIEDAAPPGNAMSVTGDGNGDGVLDSLQGNVTSLPDINEPGVNDPPLPVEDYYVTLETTQPVTLHQVDSLGATQMAAALVPGTPGIEGLAGFNFKNGFFSALLGNVGPGGSAQFTLTLPAGDTADTYFMFGPEPGNPVPHWYRFMFDAASGTGAVINGNQITLHFVDGQRGDSDLDATNGVIDDAGGPAVAISVPPPPDGGSGCSLAVNSTSPWQSSAWWLLLVLAAARFAWRRYLHGNRVGHGRTGPGPGE